MSSFYSYINNEWEKTAKQNIHGAGFFETILFRQKRIHHLNLHLNRLYNSLEAFNIPFEKHDFQDILENTLSSKEWRDQTARINLGYQCSPDLQKSTPWIKVSPYIHTPNKTYKLLSSQLTHLSFLSKHKSMSYFPYLIAHKEAIDANYDDALMLDLDNNIIEATRSALIFERKGRLYTPASSWALKSITLQSLNSIQSIKPKAIPLNRIQDYKHAYIANSLNGIKPIDKINEYRLSCNEKLCSYLNQKLYNIK